MTPERWQQVEAVLDAALDLPAPERAAFVAGACGGDADLRAEVERLLAACSAPDLVPDEPAAVFAAGLVARTAEIPAVGSGRADAGAPAGARPERVGPYRVLAEAGQGGMGTVYLAERDDGQFRMRVALKLVRRGLHLDDQFVRRFVEERRILARLEHPNVARLLDGGLTGDGMPYYVMEFVDGEPIDRYCDSRRLSLEGRLELFCRVCRGVAYAHQNKVVHRDLKPSNILVTASGEPKLVDFGIAKLLHDATLYTGELPVPTLTRTGQRLLTPEYASPEQVRGELVTEASDIYALGVLLYELLTGRRPYGRTGRTAYDVERAILEEEPTRPSAAITRPSSQTTARPPTQGARREATPAEISGARGLTPERLCQRLRGDLDAIVLTALRKEPERRYRSADDFSADVRRYLDGQPVLARGEGLAYRLRKGARRHRVSITLATLAAALTGLAAFLVDRYRAPDTLVPGPTRRVAFDAALELDPALSPDGQRIAYVSDAGGTMRVHVRLLDGGPAVVLAPSLPGPQRLPRWSPDGRTLAVQAGGRIWAVPAAGTRLDDPPRLLVAPTSREAWVGSPAWSPDGRAIAYVEDGVIRVRATAGGPVRRLTTDATEPHSLAWSPDGRWIAYVDGNSPFVFGEDPRGSTVNIGNLAPSAIWVVPASGGLPRRVTPEVALHASPVWMPDGHGLLVVSARDGDRDVYALALTADGYPAAPATRITAGLGAHGIALDAAGRRLAYAVFRNAANVWNVPIPAAGEGPATEADARPVTSGNQSIEGLTVSPDGRWLAFDSDRAGRQALYRVPLGASAGGDEPELLTREPTDVFLPHWSPDGRAIAFYRFGADGRREMRVVDAAGGASRPVLAAPRNQRAPRWAPDGRTLVFTSDETGRNEVYVTTRGPNGRWAAARRLTPAGGYAGRVSPDGRTVSFINAQGIWTVPLAGGTPRRVLAIVPAQEVQLGWAEWGPDRRNLLYKWVDPQGRASVWAVPAACTAVAPAIGPPPTARPCAPRALLRIGDAGRPSPRPEFATDGQRLYFTLSERESDVWVMELARAAP